MITSIFPLSIVKGPLTKLELLYKVAQTVLYKTLGSVSHLDVNVNGVPWS